MVLVLTGLGLVLAVTLLVLWLRQQISSDPLP